MVGSPVLRSSPFSTSTFSLETLWVDTVLSLSQIKEYDIPRKHGIRMICQAG